MTAEECPLSELPADQCGCPKHRGRVEKMIAPPRRPATLGPMLAKFEGYCRECHTPIEVGDPIAQTEDDRWVHDDCAD